jgi:hypothetical protein
MAKRYGIDATTAHSFNVLSSALAAARKPVPLFGAFLASMTLR